MRITIETQPTEPETWPLCDAPDGWLEPADCGTLKTRWFKSGNYYAQFDWGCGIGVGMFGPTSTRPVRRAATPTEIVIRQGAKP